MNRDITSANNTLPIAWKRRSNGKTYGLDGVHIMFGKVMVWLRECGTNNGLHLPLSTLAKCYTPIEGNFKAVVGDTE